MAALNGGRPGGRCGPRLGPRALPHGERGDCQQDQRWRDGGCACWYRPDQQCRCREHGERHSAQSTRSQSGPNRDEGPISAFCICAA